MGGTAAGRGHRATYPSKVLEDLEPAFMIDLAKKDLDIAIKFFQNAGCSNFFGYSSRKSLLMLKRMGEVDRIGLQFLTCFKRNSIQNDKRAIRIPAIQKENLMFSIRFPLPSLICDSTARLKAILM